MRCPHCNENIPDTAAICPMCDAILDATFLNASTEPGAAERRPSGPPGLNPPGAYGASPPGAYGASPPGAYGASPPGAYGASPPGAYGPLPRSTPPPADAPPLGSGPTPYAEIPQSPAPVGMPPPLGGAPPLGGLSPHLSDAPDLSGQTDGTSILRFDPEREKETRIVKVSDIAPTRQGASTTQRGAARAAPASLDEEDLGDLWGQVFLAYRRLRPMEKLSLFVLLALLVSAFLPWFHVSGEGFVSGIEGRGVLTAVFAFLALVVFWIRAVYRWVLLVLGQVALVALAGLMAGLALKAATATSAPSFGLYLTLLSAGAAAVVSLVAALK